MSHDRVLPPFHTTHQRQSTYVRYGNRYNSKDEFLDIQNSDNRGLLLILLLLFDWETIFPVFRRERVYAEVVQKDNGGLGLEVVPGDL